MTHDDDLLDSGTAERLTDGAVSPADAPPGYAPVAALLASAAVPGPAPDLDFDALARVARRTAHHADPSEPRRSPMLGKLLTLKAAAVAGVILIGASGAAAATGSLPRPVQSVAHDTLSHVGVDVPDDTGSAADDHGHHGGTPDASDPTTTTTGADGSVPPVVTPGSGEHSHSGTTVQDPATEPGDDSPGGTRVGDDPAADGSGDHSGTAAGSGDDGGDHQPVPATGSGGSGGSGDHSRSGDHSGSGRGSDGHSGSGGGSGDGGSGGSGSGSDSHHD